MMSPRKRQAILDRALAALEGDDRIAGVVVVGSGAVGFEDAHSDLDLCVVVTSEDEVQGVFRDWRPRFEELLPVVHCCPSTRGPSSYLYAFLLKGFLELDVGFVCLSNLAAARERWKVAFDRSGRIEGLMRSTWESRPEPDVQATYLARLDSIWHVIMHVAIALRRGQPWRALSDLAEIRRRAVELAGLRHGLDMKRFRQADQLPPELLAELQQTLVSSAEQRDIMRALRAATSCFFREAQALDEMLGLDASADLAAEMDEYLSRLEAESGDATGTD